METRGAKRQRLLRERLVPKWRRRRQLLREALRSTGLLEDLLCVVDGYLGKMEVSELRCVRTISFWDVDAARRHSPSTDFFVSADGAHIAVSDNLKNNVTLLTKDTGAFVHQLGCGEGSGEGEFDGVCGVCLHGGNVYICDYQNARVQELTKEGGFLRSFGDAAGPGKLDGPVGVAVDEQHVFVSSQFGRFVSVFNKATGAFVRKFGRKGTGEGLFRFPNGLCLDGGNVYVCDINDRVQELTKEGRFVRFIGDASGPGKLYGPVAVAVNEQHVFVPSENAIKFFAKEDGAFVREVILQTGGTPKARAVTLSDGLLYATDSFNQCIAVLEG
jgi:DNA-binding beta-propeller fold protein YncE